MSWGRSASRGAIGPDVPFVGVCRPDKNGRLPLYYFEESAVDWAMLFVALPARVVPFFSAPRRRFDRRLAAELRHRHWGDGEVNTS